ncbi:MAG TPA: phage tail protein [Vicinamibacteria bacterium]|jgi:phage tail-like protein
MPDTGARFDPVPAFRFTVTFDDLPQGGFSDCSGLQSETEVQEYAEGGLNTHTWRFPGRTKQGNVTFKRGIVNKVLWDWHHAIANGDFKSRNCTVLVHDPSGSQDVLEFQLMDAFPAKWIGPELAAGQNNLAIETLEVAHQGMTRKR